MIHLDDGKGKPKCGAKAPKDGPALEVASVSSCYPCLATLIHIDDGAGRACCGADVESVQLTDAALASGCEACRGKLMVGGMTQLGCWPRPEPSYTPEPHPDADAIVEEKKRRVDGR